MARPSIPPDLVEPVYPEVNHVTFDLGIALTGYRLFPTTLGPASPTSYSGPFLCGVGFEVTASGHQLFGYWWWCCNSGQSTVQQAFALWSITGAGTGTLVPGGNTYSGPLTAGTWNYAPLAQPLTLTANQPYKAVTGFSNSFPDTTSQFGLGNPYAAGITNGPLVAYSSSGAGKVDPYNNSQMTFSVAGTDPTANYPASNSSNDNFWIDVQVDSP